MAAPLVLALVLVLRTPETLKPRLKQKVERRPGSTTEPV